MKSQKEIRNKIIEVDSVILDNIAELNNINRDRCETYVAALKWVLEDND